MAAGVQLRRVQQLVPAAVQSEAALPAHTRERTPADRSGRVQLQHHVGRGHAVQRHRSLPLPPVRGRVLRAQGQAGRAPRAPPDGRAGRSGAVPNEHRLGRRRLRCARRAAVAGVLV